ncbi:hypothetical protein BDQ17DRAFT_1387794 [Cyathus striatus]|nr:hypothetical protein BDQ17DRAFT_1387794 [Cyathus striatus]
MSFQSLISGSECAAPANPLSQVLKHTNGDRSLQQLHALPASSAAPAREHDIALAPTVSPGIGMPIPAEFLRIAEVNGRPELNEAWVMEQQNAMRAFEESKAQASWAAEFGNNSDIARINSLPTTMQQNVSGRGEFQQRPNYVSSMGMYGGSMPMGMYGMNNPMQYGTGTHFGAVDQKGKGKSREADFEAAFAQVAASLTQRETTSRIEEVKDVVDDVTEALKSSTLDEPENPETDFAKVWVHLQQSDNPPRQEDIAKWEAEFSQLMGTQREELDNEYGSSMQQAWESGVGDFSDKIFGDKPLQFDADGIPILGDYVFEKNNQYLDPSSSSGSLLSDAKALLEQNGSLTEAALMLEAAIQKGELGKGGYEAWILLGETRNMDEREEAGMKALLHGVRKAEEVGDAGEGMLSLAISFTNESYDRASHSMLLRWLQARFPSQHVPEETLKAMTTNSSWDTHTRITDLFLGLARAQFAQGTMDPDVQIGLGVLFYTNGEYDRAKDCFESALGARPTDYLLWNRLGSCLSNGSKPEEALVAYTEALKLRPTYTRAIYNVGVACLNIGAYKEAAEHFLSALGLQESTSGDTSEQLWFTLRRALLSMERGDLADLAKPEAKTSLDVFRREGLDF